MAGAEAIADPTRNRSRGRPDSACEPLYGGRQHTRVRRVYGEGWSACESLSEVQPSVAVSRSSPSPPVPVGSEGLILPAGCGPTTTVRISHWTAAAPCTPSGRVLTRVFDGLWARVRERLAATRPRSLASARRRVRPLPASPVGVMDAALHGPPGRRSPAGRRSPGLWGAWRSLLGTGAPEVARGQGHPPLLGRLRRGRRSWGAAPRGGRSVRLGDRPAPRC